MYIYIYIYKYMYIYIYIYICIYILLLKNGLRLFMNYYHQFLYILNNLTDDGSIYDLKTTVIFFLIYG